MLTVIITTESYCWRPLFPLTEIEGQQGETAHKLKELVVVDEVYRLLLPKDSEHGLLEAMGDLRAQGHGFSGR